VTDGADAFTVDQDGPMRNRRVTATVDEQPTREQCRHRRSFPCSLDSLSL